MASLLHSLKQRSAGRLGRLGTDHPSTWGCCGCHLRLTADTRLLPSAASDIDQCCDDHHANNDDYGNPNWNFLLHLFAPLLVVPTCLSRTEPERTAITARFHVAPPIPFGVAVG